MMNYTDGTQEIFMKNKARDNHILNSLVQWYHQSKKIKKVRKETQLWKQLSKVLQQIIVHIFIVKVIYIINQLSSEKIRIKKEMEQLFIKNNKFIISKSLWTQLRKEKAFLYPEQ
jgi:hypothetical protein